MPLKDELVPKSKDELVPKPCRLKSRKKRIFRQILLPAAASSKTASKKSAPGGKHHASEGRASAKTTPKNCLTGRLKS